jgi:hypothetical protein
MTLREDTARALAFFEDADDIMLLHQLLAEVAPRARRMVGELLAGGGDEAIPPPAELRAARAPATQEQALKTLRTVNDFALLQVLTRTIGQRVEAAEIAASAEFPEGVRVRVPDRVAFPPQGWLVEGVVEATGTQLSVRLDNGETWEGPPTLAQLTATL